MDFRITNHETIVLFWPESDEGQRWLEEYNKDRRYLWFGNALQVLPSEYRIISDAIRNSNLIIGGTNEQTESFSN